MRREPPKRNNVSNVGRDNTGSTFASEVDLLDWGAFLPFAILVESGGGLNLRNVVVEYVVKIALEMSHAVPIAWGFIGRDCKIPVVGFVPASASEATDDAIDLSNPCERK
jgi:hypothetical protein